MLQRSPEWFEARRGRITASSVGAILGLSPYMKRADVMRNMVREYLGEPREFGGNIATNWGTNNEDGALIDFRIKTSLNVDAIGFVAHEDWAGCSPDGLIGKNSGLEIKCPFGLRTAHCPVPFKTLAEQPHYEAQVQFSMFVTGRDEWHFFQWVPNETRNELVAKSQEWQDKYVPALRQFHAEFLDELRENADEHRAPKRVTIDNAQARGMLVELDGINESIAFATERKKALMDSMVALADGKNADFAGRKLTNVKRSGSVSWKKVAEKYCPDADTEPFTGKGTSYWTIK